MSITPGTVEVVEGIGNYQLCVTGTAEHGQYEGEHVCIAMVASWDGVPALEQWQGNAHLLALAWNAFVTTGIRLGVDPVQLAEALGEGALANLVCRDDMELLALKSALERKAALQKACSAKRDLLQLWM